MSLSRAIEVSFGGGSIAYAKVDTAYFYNNGIIFKPTDIDLPASYQVHWADSPQASSTLETIGTSEGAPIPDDLWNRSRVIYGWIYLHPTNDSSITGYEVRIYKNVRAGLPDGTEPTPAEQSTIDQLISALNGAVEQAEDAQEAIENMSVSATTLAEGESATVTKSEQDGVVRLAFGIPKGQTGDDGYSPTANVSKTGKVATITITDKNGTTSAQVEDGTDGIDGISPSVSVTDITGGHRVVITDKDGTKSFDVEDGATGATPNLTIGTVETLEPTDDATATITGTAENPVLNFGIPKGEQGEVTLADLNSALAEKAPVITDTASGAIASFTDGADNLPLKSLIVDIDPVQDLHGQDSPYPAGGGKNLVDWTGPQTITSQTTLTTYDTSDVDTYTVSTTIVNNVSINGSLKMLLYNNNTFVAEKSIVIPANAASARYSVTMDTTGYTFTQIRIVVAGSSVGYSLTVSNVQLEKGSTATAFAPYENLCPISGWTEVNVNHSDADTTNPTTITINLGQTVYGGKLDVLSGVLTVDRAMRVFDGSADEAWSIVASGTHYRGYTYALTDIEPLTGYTTVTNALCDKLKSGTWNNAFAGALELGQTAKALGFGLDSLGITTTPALNSWLAENPLTIVYPLATPITVQLSANQINSLYGQNNLWADSGDTEVEYRADTKLFIERLTAPDSADMIADANITSGKYFMVGNSLYKATANIANGSAIIVGTNAVRKSLSEALNEINA